MSEFDARLLMNHAIPGVNAGYISRHKLLEDHLRAQQQAISTTMFGSLWATSLPRMIQSARGSARAQRDEQFRPLSETMAKLWATSIGALSWFAARIRRLQAHWGLPAATHMPRAKAPATAIGTPRISSAVSILGQTGNSVVPNLQGTARKQRLDRRNIKGDAATDRLEVGCLHSAPQQRQVAVRRAKLHDLAGKQRKKVDENLERPKI
ncbi:hypothetical protein [Mesorhizobium escarrei]|uniref:hypothetical protein n=1 Tax=Mesorhizobium escarrei TaxID=666018 RepID=UPI0020A6F7AE|nr:hypothetical protein [Mesorhizobium escarrei]